MKQGEDKPIYQFVTTLKQKAQRRDLVNVDCEIKDFNLTNFNLVIVI